MRLQRLSALLVLVLGISFSMASGVAGQETVPPAPPVAESADDEAETPEALDAAVRERIIYVPFEVLEGTFESPDASVVLPYAEYLKLREQWEKSQQTPAAPAAVITRSAYSAAVDGDLARVTGVFTINSLREGWNELPLAFGEAAVASITGEQVLLRGTGEGTYSLLLGQAGEQTVTIELAVRVKQSTEGRELQFHTPQVGVTTFELVVPEADQSIEVLPRLLMQTAGEQAAGTTKISANLGSTPTITARWHPRTSEKPELELLTTVTNDTLVTIEDGLIHTDAYLTYQVLRGRLDLVVITVPAGQRILDVSSSTRMKSWKAEEQNGQTVVTVELLDGNEKQVVVEVHTERKLPAEPITVAGLPEMGAATGIHAADAVRESGQIAIRHGADLSIAVAEQQGVVRIEQGELHERLHGNNALAFKYFSPRLTLSLSAKAVEPRLTVTQSSTLTIEEDELKLSAVLHYVVERTGVFGLSIKLPENFVVDAVESPQMNEYAVNEANRTLSVTLSSRLQGNIELIVRGHRPLDPAADMAEQSLPLLEATGVERETGSVYLFAKDAVEVITNQEGLVAAQPLPSATGQRLGEARLAAAWSYTRQPVVIPIRTVRKPTRFSASVATVVDILPETSTVATTLNFQVEYAGVDTFRFQVPESISERVQIEVGAASASGPAIKQKTASAPADGWVIWTVVMQRELVGTQSFTITYDLNRSQSAAADPAAANAAKAAPPAIVVQAVRPLGVVDAAGTETTPLVKQYGELVVLKEQSLTLAAEVANAAAEAIDVREVTLVPQDSGRIPALAYRYFKQPETGAVEVTLTTARNEIQEVVSTVVSRGLVEIVTAEDAQATYRARYLVKTSERQRLLVILPANVDVLGVFVDEREVKLEKADSGSDESTAQSYWVNVARTGESDTPFLLTFQFLWTVNPALGESDYGRGKMEFPLPEIGGEATSVATQQLRVVIWVPKEYALVGDPEGFDLETRQTPWALLLGAKESEDTGGLESWLMNGAACPTGFLMFPTTGRKPHIYNNLGGATQISVTWWNLVYNAFWLSGAVALIGWILMKTSWENKLGMLLLAAFVAVLFGLRDSHELGHGLAAARYGIVAMLGLWLLHEIAGWTRSIKASGEKSRQSPDIMSPVWSGATQRPVSHAGETTPSPTSAVPPPSPPAGQSTGDSPKPG